jgi:hypothetical protein
MKRHDLTPGFEWMKDQVDFISFVPKYLSGYKLGRKDTVRDVAKVL